ncbi:MAG: hypothetical protein AAGC60_14760 [Acidobacteriota bacterium]
MDTYWEPYSPTDNQTTNASSYEDLEGWQAVHVPLAIGTTYLVEVNVGGLKVEDSNSYENAYVAVYRFYENDPNTTGVKICQAGISKSSSSALRMNLSARGIDKPTEDAKYQVRWKVDSGAELKLYASGTNVLTATPIAEPSS